MIEVNSKDFIENLVEMLSYREEKDRGRRYLEKLLKLIESNPDLPVVPIVDSEVVGGFKCSSWMGNWGRCEVTEYYIGGRHLHFRDDDEEDVLIDLADATRYVHDAQDRDIYELSDDEWDQLFKSLPWIKCIAVYITI